MTKKIVFITSGIKTGGAEKQLALLAGGLRAHSFEPVIISLSRTNEGDALPDFANLQVIQYDCRPGPGLIASFYKIRSLLRTLRPDIIQGWMYAGNIATSLAGMGLTADIYHSIRASNMDRTRYGRQIWLNGKLSRLTKAVIANSRTGVGHHSKMGFRTQKMRVIANGIDCDSFCPDAKAGLTARAALGIGSDETVCLYVARVDPMKGHDRLSMAAGLCPEVKFIFVGDGTDRLDVPDNVITLGTRQDMSALYNAVDWLVSWSHYGEGFPNVIAEAMACGTPVCANDSGDSWFVIGDTGHKCTAHTPQQIAEEIRMLAQRPASKAERQRAVKRIKDHFSVKAMISAYAAVYQADHVKVSL